MRVNLLLGISLFLLLGGGCRNEGTIAATPEAETEPETRVLFAKDSLVGWKPLDGLLGGGGTVTMENGVLTLEEGNPINGIVVDTDGFTIPDTTYEIEVEAMRVRGREIFCGLTFPVPGRNTCVTFIAGGWGGGTTGISSLDGRDASANETMSVQRYENGKWYAIRIRAEVDYLQVWIDGKNVAAVNTRGRQLGMRSGEVEECQPLGFFTWDTTARLRNLRLHLGVGG
jgi:hypothetical protein